MTDFEVVYRKHRAWLLNYARKLTARSSYEAEDLMQDTLLVAWRDWSKISAFENIRFTLRQIMHWVWRDVMRVIKAQRRNGGVAPISFEVLQADEYEGRDVPCIDDRLRLIQADQWLSKQKPRVARRMQKLALGYTTAEIADEEHVSYQAIQMDVYRAQAKLRKALI